MHLPRFSPSVSLRKRNCEWFTIFALLPVVLSLPTSLSSSVPVSSLTTSTLSTPTSFPVIYVASAVVDCGAPLVRDICSTSFFDSLFAGINFCKWSDTCHHTNQPLQPSHNQNCYIYSDHVSNNAFRKLYD